MIEQQHTRELIRAGQYVKLANGVEFEATARTLAHWVAQFERMKAAGVRVPLPYGAENVGSADHNRGWVEALYVRDGALFMTARLIGADAIQAAQRCDFEIHVTPTLVDGKGNRYVQPIDFVAFRTDPVVPGLGEFMPLAASKRSGSRPAQTKPAIVQDAERRATLADLARLPGVNLRRW